MSILVKAFSDDGEHISDVGNFFFPPEESVNILGFVSQMISVTSTPLFLIAGKQPWVGVAVFEQNLIYKNRVRFGLWVIVCQPFAYEMRKFCISLSVVI